LRPGSDGRLDGTKWVWMSMASAKAHFLAIAVHRTIL
jgi:hypothetical protein